MLAWYLEAYLADLGSHVVVNRAAEIQHHRLLSPSWADIGHLGANMVLSGCILCSSMQFSRPPGPFWCYLGASWVPAILDASGLMLAFSWNTWGPSGARYQSSWTHLGPYGGIPEPSGRLREGVLRQKQGLEALTWSLPVAREPQIKNFKKPLKNHWFSMISGDGKVNKTCQEGSLEVWLGS